MNVLGLSGGVKSGNQDGAAAFQRGDYDAAKEMVESATRLSDFRSKVRGLQGEWDQLFRPSVPVRPRPRTQRSRLQSGLRTPEDSFRRPILEVLVELGGSAPSGQILDKVEKRMLHELNEYDRQGLTSNPSSVRWRNCAQWCRNTLVHQDGYLKVDSPYGVWEIPDRGRAHLQELQKLGP